MDVKANSEVWSKRFVSRWCLAALPFFLIAAISFFVGFTRDSHDVDYAGAWGREVLSIIPAVFVLLGLSFVTAFNRIVIDKCSNTIKFQWGLLVPLKSRTALLSDVSAVELTRELRSRGYENGAKRAATTVYPVRLLAADSKFLVHEHGGIIKARALAEELAKFIAVPMHDKSHDKHETRVAAELDVGVAQREKVSRAPKVPAAMVGRVRVSSNTNGSPVYAIQFPPIAQRYPWLNRVSWLALATAIAIVFWHFLNTDLFNLPFDAITALLNPVMIIPLVLTFSAYKILSVILPALSITADNRSVLIVKTVLGVNFKAHFHSREIESLLLKDHANEWGTGSLLFITDQRQVSIGLCQQAKELEACREMVIFAMK